MTDTTVITDDGSNPNHLESSSHTEHANSMIKRYAAGAIAPALVPLPVADLAALSAIQVTMVGHLAKIYGVKFTTNLGKSMVVSLVGNLAGISAFPIMRGLLKLIPGVGTVAGFAALASVGSAVTYAVGKVFQLHFETGGTLLDFDAEKMRGYFDEQLKEGKGVIQSV